MKPTYLDYLIISYKFLKYLYKILYSTETLKSKDGKEKHALAKPLILKYIKENKINIATGHIDELVSDAVRFCNKWGIFKKGEE